MKKQNAKVVYCASNWVSYTHLLLPPLLNESSASGLVRLWVSGRRSLGKCDVNNSRSNSRMDRTAELWVILNWCRRERESPRSRVSEDVRGQRVMKGGEKCPVCLAAFTTRWGIFVEFLMARHVCVPTLWVNVPSTGRRASSMSVTVVDRLEIDGVNHAYAFDALNLSSSLIKFFQFNLARFNSVFFIGDTYWSLAFIVVSANYFLANNTCSWRQFVVFT